MKWSESLIMEKIALRFHFNCKHLMIIPRCKWTGHECDILCVTKSLKIIDFEIKISRADFLQMQRNQNGLNLVIKSGSIITSCLMRFTRPI